ncbi:Hpt domain-containing protein [uncultured Cyclobacterium sp.]|uniref:Hpt domain-containing protein n=1 Tax=uncultured Cyclobacterium sp. TaxID=453820 RepID=UPI0030EE9114|tara:strand:+ start:58915 stop:59277 length:363 start_codon:yes stop_codon:yes gene_type:complete
MEDSQEKRYNLENLEEISGGSNEFVIEMIKLFISQSENTIPGFEQAMENKNYKVIRDLAHQIKPSIDNIKITSLMPIIREVEHLAEMENQTGELSSKIMEVNAGLKVVIFQLQAELIKRK